MLQRLSLSTKFKLLLACFASGFLIFGIVSMATLQNVKINGPRYKVISLGKDLQADILPPPAYILEAYALVMESLAAGDAAQRETLIKKGEELSKSFDERITYWETHIPDAAMRKVLIEEAKQPALDFFALRDTQFNAALKAGDKAQAEALVSEKMRPLYHKHLDAILRLVDQANAFTEAQEKAAQSVVKGTNTLLPVLLVGILAVVVGLTRSVSNGIVAAMRRTAEVLDAVAGGDMRRRLDYDVDDEIGHMASSVNRMVASIRNVLESFAQIIHRLSASSQQLSSLSTEMSATAEETASQSNSVSAAAEQVSRNLQTVAAGAEEMSASINEIAKNAVDSAKVASEAVEIAGATSNTIAKLGESSAEIGNVIKLITSIAQQTNLLALNATIEAARAGESGKGFAVVANEVKELAKATATAAAEISQRIEAIQTDTGGATEAIGRITAVIANINAISNVIATAVEEQTATTNDISRNVTEAAMGSSEIARNIVGVAQAAEATAKGATESQEAAVSLAGMGTELQRLVDNFQFKSEGGHSEAHAGAFSEAHHQS